MLEARGLALTDAQRDLISSCRDPATLERWLRGAVTAPSVADLLRDP